jgi:ATP-dependent Clp protease ATP-binding subunit ClpC
LGLVRDGEGVAQRVLQNLGLDIKQIRVVVMRMISEKAKA